MKKISVYLALVLLLFRCSETDLIQPVNILQPSTQTQTESQSSFSLANTVFVSATGNDSGDGSAVNPWKTLRYAVTKVPASQGYTIQLSAGTFIETGLIEVPLGVNVIGAGIDQTILKAATSFYYYPASPAYATDKFLISLNAGTQLNGNQTLKGFTIDGDLKKLHGGIYVRYRSNVTIDGVKVQNTNFTGMWLWDVKDSKLRNSQIINSSWGSTSYCVGALNLGNVERVEIDKLSIDENKGYGIKAIGPSGNNNILNLKIHDSRVSVHPYGIWNGGSAPNIAIELWQVNLVGSEIYNTYVDNTISLINSNATPSTGIQTIRVHHNTIDMETRAQGAGYGVELTIHDAEVDHNYFLKGTYGIANWDNPMKNWNIHHNTFYALQGTYPGEVVRSQWSGLHNVKLYNNTIEFASTKTMNVVGLYGGASDNVDVKNNLFIDNNTGYSYYPNQLIHLENGATLNTLTVQNNSFSRLPVGSTPGSYQNNQTSDPQINKTSNRPDPYYMPKVGSPLINTGLNLGYTFVGSAPDIGAYEYNAVSTVINALPQVSITSPVNNSNFTTGASVTITANAIDPDGTIGKVEFFNGATLIAQDITSPYSFAWANVPAGNYTLTAKATDNQNMTTTSSSVVISVTSAITNQPPVVSLTSPANNAALATSTSVTLTATATDNNGSIAKVEFFNGSTKLGEDVTSPYSLIWSATAGTCVISAKATDNAGAITTSNSATVLVSTSSAIRLILDSSDAILTGKVTTGYDAQAQRGTYFYVAPGNGKNYYIPPPAAAAFNFQLTKTDNYVIWVKVKSPTSSNQGHYIYNGKGRWFTWLAGIHTEWTWVKMTDGGAPALFSFSQGTNQFQMAWFDENVKVDQVLITNDLTYTP